jgi:hypothetical protein
MNGWEAARASAAVGEGEEEAEGEVAGAEVTCREGAALGGGGDGADRDPGWLVGHSIAGTRGMSNISSEFGNVSQLALLPSRPWRRHPPKRGDQRLVVSHHVELPPLQHETKMPKGRKQRCELSIKCRVTTLRWQQLL